VDLAGGVGRNDVAGEDEVVEEPHVVGFFGHELRSSGLVHREILFQEFHLL